MIFRPEFIPKIISGEKTQTRRLVKKCERYFKGWNDYFDEIDEKGQIKIKKSYGAGVGHWNDEKGGFVEERIKWQVGKTYAVQIGRGKPCMRYCPVCEIPVKNKCPNCLSTIQPLRIRLTAIRKEKLFDISGEDAEREGFKTFDGFIIAFLKINRGYAPIHVRKKGWWEDLALTNWNPEVWVLEFEVVT